MLVEDKMNGMASRMLRKLGFYRQRGIAVFFRHTVGLGGIYVEILHDGLNLTIRDCQERATFSCVSELRRVIERLDEIEDQEAAIWKERVSQFECKTVRVLEESQMEAS